MEYRILAADDEKEILDSLELFLNKEGIKLLKADNGISALELFKAEHPHMMLLDVMMPGIDGFSVLRKVREFSHVPAIMLTAKTQDYDKILGLELGADDYILKPFNPLEVVAISFYLKKHIDKPLKLLMAGMDEVSEGKRDVVIDYSTDREFENIRDRFNLMAKKLKESEEEKHRVEQSRNQMLLELAHDIKNPIASIKGSICALEEGLVGEEKRPEYYRTIRMKSERICTLIDDMNTSLKMESDDYKLNPENTDVCELVRRICVEFYEDLTEGGRDFDIDIPDEPIFTEVDPQLFVRVIHNLLANAGKYNVTGQNIAVKVSRDEDRILVEVSDDGEPIAEEFIPRLFEAFARGDKTRKTDGGTGLGLAISRKIMEKHGGTLDYHRVDELNVFSVALS